MSVDKIVTAKRDYEGEITHLKVCEIKHGEAMNAQAVAREDVIDDIRDNGSVYYVANRDSSDEDSYVLSKEIRVFSSKSGAYLRTDDEQTNEDLLANLPNF